MLKILKIKEKDYKNIYIISDIHGKGRLLEGLLEKINYDSEDLFLILGDSFDRGEEPRKTYEIIKNLENKTNLIHLKGNHEKMLEDYYIFDEKYPYLIPGNGSEPTIKMLNKDEILLDEVLEFINQMPHIVESENTIFVHAGIYLDKNIEKQNEEYVLWTKEKFWIKNTKNRKKIIYGHIIQENGCIKNHKEFNAIGLDCGSFKYKRICCYNLKEDEAIYFSEDDYGK